MEEALCAASSTHSDNERLLEKNILKIYIIFQYHNSLSAVVKAITSRKITPDIVSVNSLRSKLDIRDTIYEHDMLAAYSLGRIHNNIYRINENLLFLIIFPTPYPIVFDLYKPFSLPFKNFENWKMLSFSEDTRLINFKNRAYITSISGWSKEGHLVVIESENFKNNLSGAELSVPAPVNNYFAMRTFFGIWSVCENFVKLWSWGSVYDCHGVNYTADELSVQLDIATMFDNSNLNFQYNFEKFYQNYSKFNMLLENQNSEISNRSLLVQSYINQLNNLIKATKEGS